jgi:hypothetical protein
MLNLIGERFGKLTVKEELPSARTPGGYVQRLYQCVCDCGNVAEIRQSNLRTGNSQSCGCTRIKHGGYGSRLYSIWRGMVQRCTVSTFSQYKNYGARGIRVCDSWLKFKSFMQWAEISGYAANLTIERVDNNKDYTPDNCTWIPHAEQAKNRRSCVRINYNGSVYTATELSILLGIKYTTLLYRHRNGKPLEL